MSQQGTNIEVTRIAAPDASETPQSQIRHGESGRPGTVLWYRDVARCSRALRCGRKFVWTLILHFGAHNKGFDESSCAVPGYSLDDVAVRTGLSERWIRELVKRHGLNVLKVPGPGGGQFVFSREDFKQIERIHERNQLELERRRPACYAVVGKRSLVTRRSGHVNWRGMW